MTVPGCRLPTSFAFYFAPDVLEAEANSVVALDADGTILWTNSGWTRFALQNDGAQVLIRHGVGTSYFEGISPTTRSFFEESFARALDREKVFEHEYDCSSADTRRLYRLRALPLRHAGLLLEHSMLWQSADANARDLAPAATAYANAHGFVVQCSHCRRVRRDRHWDWVPAWAAKSPAMTTHALCDICMGYHLNPKLRRP